MERSAGNVRGLREEARKCDSLLYLSLKNRLTNDAAKKAT